MGPTIEQLARSSVGLLAATALLVSCGDGTGDAESDSNDVAIDVTTDSAGGGDTSVDTGSDAGSEPEPFDRGGTIPGACGDEDSYALAMPAAAPLRTATAPCVGECIDDGNPSACALACLDDEDGAIECKQCVAELASCAADACPGCGDVTEPDCGTCIEDACRAEFVGCAGLYPSSRGGRPTDACVENAVALRTAIEGDDVSSCVTECVDDGPDLGCVVGCIEDDAPEIGAECAYCIGSFALCAAAWCPGECGAGQLDSACIDCARTPCVSEASECTGLDEDSLSRPLPAPTQIRVLPLHFEDPVLTVFRDDTLASVGRYLEFGEIVAGEIPSGTFGLGLTHAASGVGADVIATSPPYDFAPGAATTVTTYDTLDGPRLAVHADAPPEGELSEWEFFNAAAGYPAVSVWTDATTLWAGVTTGALGEARPLPDVSRTIYVDVDGDEVADFGFPIEAFGEVARVTLWFHEHPVTEAVITASLSTGVTSYYLSTLE